MDKIAKYLSEEAVLVQLAEECSELSQVCLKMVRKIKGENPTPKTMEEIHADLKEELADVILSLCVVEEVLNISHDEILEIEVQKLNRWLQRLEEGKKNDVR